MKAIVLFSGGLDSILSAKIVSACNIELEALHFYSVFSPSTYSEVTKKLSFYTNKLGMPLKVFDISCDLIDLVKNPKYGYGSNLNPCIDCKILMFKRARKYMQGIGAQFIVSGEVLGERPMSQRKEIFNLIEKESGLYGLILRPLSAKLLKQTIPEKEGWIKRDKLYAINGRSRRPQMELAKELGIYFYPTPAGGCLLTDPGFSRRLKDLLQYQPSFDVDEVSLLKVGRHFRVSPTAKVIIPRTETEEKKLLILKDSNFLMFIPSEIKGRLSLGVGSFTEEDIKLAAGVVASYLQKEFKYKRIKVRYPDKKEKLIVTQALSKEDLDKYRVN
jgi:tRNA U34 2-thiouridine synthase MnmA/TrmU